MKEVTIVGYCDGGHDLRVVSAVERTVQIDGSKPVVLDLCEECDKSILALLMLMERGTVLVKKAKEPKEPKPENRQDKLSTTCPECGHVSTSRQGLGQHLRSQHNIGFRDLAKAS